MHNKSVYFRIGLRKMVNRSSCKDLHKKIVIEADGKTLDLPHLEGVIVLNILSWGGGANPWGLDKDDTFTRPTHYDGLLEVVGICGVLHMGQIYSGLRTGIRLAQAAHFIAFDLGSISSTVSHPTLTPFAEVAYFHPAPVYVLSCDSPSAGDIIDEILRLDNKVTPRQDDNSSLILKSECLVLTLESELRSMIEHV
ncbi:unnamed protein product [Dibothriocephalus latus]|uniref:Diacylglycerol kinase accessory domain-containing protein n=1 Tax=Dibothriocephalus latus TaxID=60516 RepID=A0A3P7P363_DIBLA|nr:unnamed protein product [Dibothriocephalus latus]